MAVSSIKHYGLLNAYFRYADISIWHANQLIGGSGDAQASEPGQQIFVQPERDDIAQSIADATALIARMSGVLPQPTYLTETFNLRGGYTLNMQRVTTAHRRVSAIGKRAVSLIQSASIVYTDTNSDGIQDLATIEVATSVSADEIQVFFRVSDGAAGEAHEQWRIEPVRIEQLVGGVKITGHKALFTHPALWQTPYKTPYVNASSKNAGNVLDTANFVTSVDVYRVYTNTTDAARLTLSNGTIVTAQTSIEDGGNGWINATYTVPEGVYPASLTLAYRAGLPALDEATETAFLRLANCRQVADRFSAYDNARLARWQWDNEIETINDRPARETPFGSKRGEVAAWETFKAFQHRKRRA